MPPERLFRPFQGRTIADADRAAEGASLPLPEGTRLCGCGAVLLHACHRAGPLHRARTQAAAAPSSAAAPPPPPPPGPSGAAAQLMVQRAAQEPEFALWLLQVAAAHATHQGAPLASAAGPPPLPAPVLQPGPPAPIQPPAAPAPDLPPGAPTRDQPPAPPADSDPPGAQGQAPPNHLLPAAAWEPADREAEIIPGLSPQDVDLLEAMLDD